MKRYGSEEVRKWPFEVWNEPDVPGFWGGTQEGYFHLYEQTATAIKEVDSDLSVGGPATCPASINWITPFLEMCDRKGVPVDFVSTHSYYADKSEFTGEYMYQTLHPLNHAQKQFHEARSRVRNSPFPDLPLHITEYNTSWTPRTPIHDTAFNAAFLGPLLSTGGDLADSFSYWTFSDVFEENDIPRSILHGGFGLLGLRGIRKPTFHLFAFFARLGECLLHRDEDLILTKRSDGTIVLVAWNPVVERRETEKKRIRLDLSGMAKESFVKRQRVNEDQGNAWTCWRLLGRPRYPSRDQLHSLQDASVPGFEIRRMTASEGHLVLEFTMDRNEVTLIEMEPIEDESASYVGLDDSKTPGY
ncbi:xylan 1,4-beta-xylosidase [bacterium]|nr:xylan 1,4-beta-xylosidase [bacterium]